MARSRRTRSVAPRRLILDSGAVIALSRDDPRARAVLRAAWEAGVEVSIPAVVLAETVRGAAADAPVNRVARAVGSVDEIDAASGRTAGALLGRTRSSATVDAIVVGVAIERGGAVILTGDPDDLRLLAGDHPEVIVQALG